MARRRLTPAQPGYLGPVAKNRSAMPQDAAAPIAKVSGQSAEAAALRELAEGIEIAKAEGRMIVQIPLKDIAQGHLLRDRIQLDREDLDALKQSIRSRGQQVPAEITPLDGEAEEGMAHRFGLISGWRRLRALTELFDETNDIRFSTLRALIRPARDAVDSYVAMVDENEIRAGLSYYERARLVAETTKCGVFATRSEALNTLFASASRAKKSKIGSFVDIHQELGDVLSFPTEIPERLGLAIVSKMRSDGVASLRQMLADHIPATAKAESAILTRFTLGDSENVSRAKHANTSEQIRPDLILVTEQGRNGVVLTLRGPGADKLVLEQARQALKDALQKTP